MHRRYDRRAKPVRGLIAKFGESLVSSPAPPVENVLPDVEADTEAILTDNWQGDYEELGIPMPTPHNPYGTMDLNNPNGTDGQEQDAEELAKQREEDFRSTREQWLKMAHDTVDLEPPSSTNYIYALLANYER